MKKAFAYIILVLAAVLVVACKKENNDTELPSLRGLVITESPKPYVAPGTTVTLHADLSDIITSDDSDPGTIGLYWVVNDSQRDTVTRDARKSNPAFSYTASEVGKVTITCYAFASGYNNSYSQVTFSAIDPETSLSGLEGNTTSIGGNKFYVTQIEGLTWLANNLYGTESGVSYYLSDVTDSFLGKFYTWEEALSACPEGWTLPTAEQWDTLGEDACALMANATLLDEQMWTYWPDMAITNSLKFNAIPAGYVDLTGGETNVQGFMDFAIFWTASPSEDEAMAQYRYIYSDRNKIQSGVGSRNSLALSVRCIRK